MVQRPEPKLNIGQVDSGVALVLCDAAQADMPIVYCSEAFCALTGYSEQEVLGRNCRFLQSPPTRMVNRNHGHEQTAEDVINMRELNILRSKLQQREEIRVELINYKKDGTKFVNLVTIIPVTWDPNSTAPSEYKRYIVGFQANDRMYNIVDDTVDHPDVINDEMIYPELLSTGDNTSSVSSPEEKLPSPGASDASD